MEENKEIKESKAKKQEQVAEKPQVTTAQVIFKNNLLNFCVLAFAAIMTFFTLLSFVILWVRGGFAPAYVLSFYVLPMLLAAPTLKVFMDKSTCPVMRKLNVGAVITIFASILFMTVCVLFDLMII